jgi:protein gp37
VNLTPIEWATKTWNPVTGCDRVSEGCDHCYALTLAKRLKAMGNPRYQVDGGARSGPGFGVTLHPDKLGEPFGMRKPERIFVNSMSDLFHEDVPDEFIASVFRTMNLARRHQFLILTKRPGRMQVLLRDWSHPATDGPVYIPEPLSNVWLGVSVENQKWADVRIPHLLRTPAAVRFLSCEPLLGPVDLGRWLLDGQTGADAHREQALVPALRATAPIDWVIVGGESGPGDEKRPRIELDLDWARSLRDQCVDAGVPFFFKQVGGPTPKSGGRLLDGRTWDEVPTVREAVSA